MGDVAERFEQRRTANKLRADGMAWWQIAATLRDRYPTLGGLAACRQAHGWSQERAAREWSKRWPHRRPLTQKVLSAWECWPGKGSRPSLDAIESLAELYGVAAVDLLHGWADHRETPESSACRYALGVDRRGFLGAAAVTGAAIALHTPTLLHNTNDITQLETVAHDAWRHIHEGADTLRWTTQTLQHLNTTTFRAEQQRQRAQRLKGHLHYLAGYSHYNNTNDTAAWAHLNEAFRIAQLTGDDRLAVLTLIELSIEAAYAGNGHDALDCARAAHHHARGFADQQILSRLAAREALAYATLGDTHNADTAFTVAERHFDRSDRNRLDDGTWLASHPWCGAGLQNSISAAHLRTGRTHTAVHAAETAYTRCEPGLLRSRVEFGSQLATAQVAAGQIDAAAATIIDTSTLLHTVNAPRVVADLQSLRPALETHHGIDGADHALHSLNTLNPTA